MSMFVKSAICSKCGAVFPSDSILTTCEKCSGALLFEYDLDKINSLVNRQVLERRKDTFWKFRELLPLKSSSSVVSLGEPYTPILQLHVDCELKNVFAKDDGRLPTGTFKARGMALAVSKLKELGVKKVAVPSAGNAAAALAAYGSNAELQVYAFMPRDVSDTILTECVYLNAKVYLVDGLINHAAKIVRDLKGKYRWFDISTSKQPYRFEGYKAMAYELAEQFEWKMPDNVIFPTGGGEGVIGLWKGFNDMVKLGWIDKMPRLIIVQSSGCAPLVEAYDNNDSEVRQPWKNCETMAGGLRVPFPYASYLVLRAVRETKGIAVSVDEMQITHSMRKLFRMGVYACPEASATLAALIQLQQDGELDVSERTLLYITGTAMKHFDALKVERTSMPVLRQGANSLD